MSNAQRDANKIYKSINTIRTSFIGIAGNGGSAAIANHIEADWVKCSNGRLEMLSFCSNPSMLTMIANDYGYEYSFSWQVESRFPLMTHIILISSSGNSPNILQAARLCKKDGIKVIGLTGFNGGELKKLADVSIHINSKDYEEAEDYHMQVLHEVSRMLRSEV